jgi:hypothetical protein
MKGMIQDWCHECAICQQAKPERAKYPGLLQPIPVPAGAWKVISMDFVEGLPKSENSNCIMVIVSATQSVGVMKNFTGRKKNVVAGKNSEKRVQSSVLSFFLPTPLPTPFP